MIPSETGQLLRLITQPCLVCNREGVIAHVNPSLCELLGREMNRLIGLSLLELAAGPAENTLSTLRMFFGSGDWLVGRLSLYKSDGSEVEFQCKGCVMQRPSPGQPALVAIQRDQQMQFQIFGHQIDELNAEIRLRRQTEEQLRERSAKLEQEIVERKKAEQHVMQLSMQNRLILDSAGEGIYGLDIDGLCTFVNPAALQILGFSAEELVGRPIHQQFHHTHWDGQPYPEENCPAHASYRRGEVCRGRDWFWRKDGSGFPVEFISTPIVDAGKIIGAVVTFRDITKLKQGEDKISELNRDLERRVVERTAQLEAANKELEAFAYSVSHDLRAPLRAIDGFSHILLEEYSDKLDDEGKRLLGVVRSNASRMAQLIDDILKFSRAGRVELTFSEIDMESLVREAIEELQYAADGRKLELNIGHLPPAKGDIAMMRQVFVNLLSNAVKFSRCRNPAKIDVGCSIMGNEAVYYVKDNGVGFDNRYVDKLFGVFQRLHSTSEFEGSGIGLAIVKRIITRHGGRVWAEGNIGEGASIYFALPIKA